MRKQLAIKIGFLESSEGPRLSWIVAMAPGFASAVPMNGAPVVRLSGQAEKAPFLYKCIVSALVEFVRTDVTVYDGESKKKILASLTARSRPWTNQAPRMGTSNRS
jgi:hypothetical protein